MLEWYDELARLTDSPVVALNRAVAVGEVDGPLAGLQGPRRTWTPTYPGTPPSRHTSTSGRATSPQARELYAAAARAATSAAERDHLTRQAARLHEG